VFSRRIDITLDLGRNIGCLYWGLDGIPGEGGFVIAFCKHVVSPLQIARLGRVLQDSFTSTSTGPIFPSDRADGGTCAFGGNSSRRPLLWISVRREAAFGSVSSSSHKASAGRRDPVLHDGSEPRYTQSPEGCVTVKGRHR